MTKRNKKSKKSSGALTRKNRGLIIASCVALLLVGIPFAAIYADKENGRRALESYLESKYEQDFIVSTPSREASGFGVEGYLESVAHPADDEDLKFIARTSSGGASDNYPAALWKKEEQPVLEVKLNEVFGRIPEYSLEIHSMNTFSKRIVGPKVPSLEQTTLQYPGEVPYTLRIFSDQPLRDSAQSPSALKLNSVLLYLKGKNVNASVQYIYKNTELMRNEGWSIDSNEFEVVDDVEDLMKLFEVWSAR